MLLIAESPESWLFPFPISLLSEHSGTILIFSYISCSSGVQGYTRMNSGSIDNISRTPTQVCKNHTHELMEWYEKSLIGKTINTLEFAETTMIFAPFCSYCMSLLHNCVTMYVGSHQPAWGAEQEWSCLHFGLNGSMHLWNQDHERFKQNQPWCIQFFRSKFKIQGNWKRRRRSVNTPGTLDPSTRKWTEKVRNNLILFCNSP